MRCWHYTIYRPEGEFLLPDHHKNKNKALPYLEILKRSEQLMIRHLESERTKLIGFDYSTVSYADSPNPDKWAAEAVFEAVRQKLKEVPSVSRLNCVYLCRTKEAAVRMAEEDWIRPAGIKKEDLYLLACEAEENSLFSYDIRYFDEAYRAMEHNDVRRAARFAEQYWKDHHSPADFEELVCGSPVRILKREYF